MCSLSSVNINLSLRIKKEPFLFNIINTNGQGLYWILLLLNTNIQDFPEKLKYLIVFEQSAMGTAHRSILTGSKAQLLTKSQPFESKDAIRDTALDFQRVSQNNQNNQLKMKLLHRRQAYN